VGGETGIHCPGSGNRGREEGESREQRAREARFGTAAEPDAGEDTDMSGAPPSHGDTAHSPTRNEQERLCFRPCLVPKNFVKSTL